MDSSAITMNNVSFAYASAAADRRAVLKSVSLSIFYREVVCLVGESGSGKTTLLNLLSGLLVPASGQIGLSGQISYMPQDDLLLPFRTAWQNACLAIELHDCVSSQLLDEVSAMLGVMKLRGFLNELPAHLSGGMKRRISLARQLLTPAGILLLDEPFGEQDRAMRETLEDMLVERSRSRGNAALVVTHDLESAVAISDRVLILGSNGLIDQEWKCPEPLARLVPHDRRHLPDFANAVTDLWHELFRVTDNA